jgi:hypothetical protein
MLVDEKVLLADGLEAAFIGIGSQQYVQFAVYDEAKVLALYVERDEMTPEEAREFYEFNVVGAYVGDRTPVFVTRCTLADLETDGDGP